MARSSKNSRGRGRGPKEQNITEETLKELQRQNKILQNKSNELLKYIEKMLKENQKYIDLLQQDQKGSDCDRNYEEKLRIRLVEEQLDLKEEMHNIELCAPYVDFFKKIHRPLQILLGLEGKIGREEIDPGYLNHLVQDDFADLLSSALKGEEKEIKEGKFELKPKKDQGKAFDRTAEKKRFEDKKIEEIEKGIESDKTTLESCRTASMKKEVIQGLGRMIEEFQNKMEATDGKFPVNSELIDRLSAVARTVLELNGIYPMFIEEAVGCSQELEGFFSLPNRNSGIAYPGFFIKVEGENEWEILFDCEGQGKLEKK